MPPTKYLKFVCCNYLLIDLIKLIVYEKMWFDKHLYLNLFEY
jgi:hypothetical protein